jgi:hypothetical protein
MTVTSKAFVMEPQSAVSQGKKKWPFLKVSKSAVFITFTRGQKLAIHGGFMNSP